MLEILTYRGFTTYLVRVVACVMGGGAGISGVSNTLAVVIRTPSANLITQKSKLPHHPERLPLRMLEKTVA